MHEAPTPAVRPLTAVLLAAATIAALLSLGWSTPFTWGPTGACALTALAAAVAAVLLTGPGTAVAARVVSAAATAAALGLGWEALSGVLGRGQATFVTAVVALSVWAAAGATAAWRRSGVELGAGLGTLMAAGMPALTGLASVLAVPGLPTDGRSSLVAPEPGLLLAEVGGWVVLAALAGLVAWGMAGHRPSPAVPALPIRVRDAVVAAGWLLVAGGLVLATAADVAAWVPAAAVTGAGMALWAVAGTVRRTGALPVVTTVAALTLTVLAAGWVAPLAWGLVVLAVLTAAAAGTSARSTVNAGTAAVSAVVAGVSAVALAPLAVTAGGAGATGSPVQAIALALGGAVLLAVAPWMPTARVAGTTGRDILRWALSAVGVAALVVAALVPNGPAVLGVVLALGAVGLLLVARAPRVHELRYAAVFVAVGSCWAFLAAGAVTVLEAWTVPAAAGLLIAGLMGSYDPHRPFLRHPSWLTVGPALLVLVLPSAALLLSGQAPLWRLALLALTGTAGLALGLGRHEQAPALLGAVALLAVAVQVLSPVVAATPLWVVLALSGGLLTWIGFTWERRRDQARHAGESWARFV